MVIEIKYLPIIISFARIRPSGGKCRAIIISFAKWNGGPIIISFRKFLRRAFVAVESRGHAASVRDTERTLAIMLRRAERAIRMFHKRAGAASLYEHWLHRLDGHQSARWNDNRDSAKRNDNGLIPFRNFSANLFCLGVAPQVQVHVKLFIRIKRFCALITQSIIKT